MLGRILTTAVIAAVFLTLPVFGQSGETTSAASTPTNYHAVSNRTVYSKPPVPPVGPAGWRFVDPTFASRILRVTDANTDTRSGYTGSSFSTPSAAHQLAWNATSTRFYVRSLSGWYFAFNFDPATMTATRIQIPTRQGVIETHVEPQFSFVSGNILYAATRDQTQLDHDYPVIHQYDFNTASYTILLNLREHTAVPPDTYAGGISSSAAAPEQVAVMFGGHQDSHYKVAVFQPAAPATTLTILDTKASTITRRGVTTATPKLDFLLHHTWIDHSGRYVVLYPVSGIPVHYMVWDLATDAFTPVTTRAFGHDALGYGWQINQDCCASGAPYDGSQWQLRTLASPASPSDLINPQLSPRQVYIADHTSWNNARPDRLVPILSSSYRYYNGTYNTTPWRAWDDEILAVQTEAGGAGATVWRFAHHRSNISRDDGIDGTYFWYQPRGVISPNGRWALFTSNWEKTLGAMPIPDWGGSYRTDVFIVSLAAGTFTDDPLVAQGMVIRAAHFNELRERIDLLRVRLGLQPYTWTDGFLVSGLTVKAVHLTEMRTALQQAYAAAGRSFPALTDPVVTAGSTTIRASHIQELRQAVVTLEGS